jgi:3-phosphoshikimate 1-carboxyvinyltransferase
MKYKIKPSKIVGELAAPPSKSHTLRALLFGLMGKGRSTIENYLISPDTTAMVEAIKKFGAEVQFIGDRIEVIGVDTKLQRPSDVIQSGNSGLVLRLISGLSALLDCYVVITGDESIRSRRPIKPLLDTFTSQNVFAESSRLNGYAPVIIKGPMKPGVMAIEGSDSQPVSALLIATSFMKGPSEIYVMNPGEKPWVDVTLDWLKMIGSEVINCDYRHYKIKGKTSYPGFSVSIPGDFSSAAYSIGASIVTKGKMRVDGLSMTDSQSDKNFIDVLKKMGARIKWIPEEYAIEVDGKGQIAGKEIDINCCIDMTPLLAVIGCFANTPTVIHGGEIARFKESDRIASITKELRKMGANIEEKEDGMVIYPSKLKGAKLESHGDHRIALSLIVAAFGAEGDSEIEGVECIAKTYPTFLCDFCLMGGRIE